MFLRGIERRMFGLSYGDVVTVPTEVYRLVPSTGISHLFIHNSIQSISLEYLKMRECSWNTLFLEMQDVVDVSMVTLKLRMGRH